MVRAVVEGADRFGRLDVVISNAGISGDVGALTDYPSDVCRRTMDVHVLGAFHILKHAVPRISDGGSIIITSSVVGTPEEIAHGMLYLAADESAMVTSHTFSIDAGLSG